MMGMLARLGIKKGEPYKPDAKLQAMLDKAGPEALQFMIERLKRTANNQEFLDSMAGGE